ncbi:sugar nucleotide-binding protein [Patescibacteria group bacterium]|nr:sugar nucleotide-binding protein [Patescibacteria group bacterium]MBU1885227.1 sugar nucleotide-binding protein [Patescibacteria group bacterium]
MQKTPILTTGLTGLVGSRIAKMLGDKFEFFNMDLTVGVDITDKNKIEKFVKEHPAKVMIHLAAYTDVNGAFEQTDNKEGLCYQVNVVGTKNIAEICKENNIYFIHISTGLVFSGTKTDFYIETDIKDPIEWYGQTKAWAEDEVEKILNHYAIARIDYPFRAQFEAKPDIVAKTKQGLSDGTLYPQFSDMIITPTYIDDIARAIDTMIEKQPQGIYQLNGSTSLSTYELAKKVATAFGFDPTTVKEGSLVEYLKTTSRPYQKTMKMSNEKIQRELGIKPMTIDEALEDIKQQLN